MSVELTAPVSAALDRLRRLIAASATFRNVVAAGDEAEARGHIHIAAADDEAEGQQIPRAIINQSGRAINIDVLSEIDNIYTIDGRTLVAFEFRVPEDHGHEGGENELSSQHNWYYNTVGLIVDEMMKLARRGESVSGETHLNVSGVSLVEGPWRDAQEEDEYDIETEKEQPLWWSEWEFSWRR